MPWSNLTFFALVYALSGRLNESTSVITPTEPRLRIGRFGIIDYFRSFLLSKTTVTKIKMIAVAMKAYRIISDKGIIKVRAMKWC